MSSPLFSLEERTIVVTGGLGQLGQQYTRAILDAGGRVACLDTHTPKSPPLSHDRLMYLKGDVTSRASLEAALADIVKRWEIPYGLINNAAIDAPPNAPASENGPFETYPESSWDQVMNVNVKGVMLASQVFGGAMAKAKRGSIVNISSIYGVVSPDQSLYQYRRNRGEIFFKPIAYSASKSALMNLTRYLATYWAAEGVRVNSLVLAGVFNQQDKEFLAHYEKRIPIGRMARADEYNGSVIYLLSDASSYMTGASMVVDGGWLAW